MDIEMTKSKKLVWICITVLSVSFCLFHLFTAGYRELTGMEQRLVHLSLGLGLVYLTGSGIKKITNIKAFINFIFAIITIAAGTYLFYFYEDITFRLGRYESLDIICGTIVLISVLIATKRTIGWALPILALISLAYGLWGNLIKGPMGHSSLPIERIIGHLTLTTEGIFGTPLGASASIVAIFIIFATVLNQIGAGEYFVSIVMSKLGKSRGGAAKAAVGGSGLMGMLTGSVIANVMGTGTFTIPLMKKNGYKPKVAGAVEAVSSTGGQIMPPVMGAAAYVIAEMLAMPFSTIIKAAIIPAFLYYLTEFLFVDLEARRTGLLGLNDEEVAEYRSKARGRLYLTAPLFVLILLLMALNWTPSKAAFFAAALAFIIGFIQKTNKLALYKIIDLFRQAAKGCLEVVAATACAGIIVGIMSLTGLGIKLSTILINLSGGNLIVLLVLTMLASLLLGMGLTTTACYIILAILVAPALVTMGVEPLAAHFFVFFFGIYSAITPPVALGSYAAASLAGSDPFATGFTSWRIALPGFIIPFIFVYSPSLIGIGSPVTVLTSLLSASVGVFFATIATVGYFTRNLNIFMRAIMLAAGLLLIIPGYLTDGVGILIGGMIIIIEWKSRNRDMEKKVMESSHE